MFKILVVEDDRELNKSVCAFLGQNGYDAVGCLGAEEAYDALYDGGTFDMIISDIMMPGVDGFEFAENVRELSDTIPILFMTARDDMAAKQRGFKVGIDDYMVKPIDLEEQKDGARPAIAGELPDLTGYDTIFIGAPVWWGDWPMILYTFFESTPLEGKTLIPFSTHEGSGLSGFDRSLAAACPDCTVADGLAVRGADAQNDPEKVRASVSAWLDGLSLLG